MVSFLPSAFALEIPTNITSDNITQSSVDIDWGDVEWSIGYVVLYGTDGSMNLGGDDFFPESQVTLTDLSAGKDYSFQVVAVDEAIDEFESAIMSFSTLPSEQDPLSLDAIVVHSDTEISFDFNYAIDENVSSTGIFNIQSTQNAGEQIDVDTLVRDQVNPSIVHAVLASPMASDHQYQAVVVNVMDIYARSIESWIDGVENFTSPTILVDEDEETIEDFNAASDVVDEAINNSSLISDEALSGESVSADETEQNAASVWATAQTLPNTWPEHILLFILAMVFSILFFVYKFKKA